MSGSTFSALTGLNNASKMVDQIVAKVAFKANVNVIKANDKMIGWLLDIKS